MPFRRAITPLPPRAEIAQRAIASATRIQILRALDDAGEPLSAIQLTERCGVTLTAFRKAVNILEECGYVTTIWEGARHGTQHRFQLEQDTLLADVRALAGWLMPTQFGELAETAADTH